MHFKNIEISGILTCILSSLLLGRKTSIINGGGCAGSWGGAIHVGHFAGGPLYSSVVLKRRFNDVGEGG